MMTRIRKALACLLEAWRGYAAGKWAHDAMMALAGETENERLKRRGHRPTCKQDGTDERGWPRSVCGLVGLVHPSWIWVSCPACLAHRARGHQ